MKCPKCNAEIADGSLFCTECGAKIENNASQETAKPEQNSGAKQKADAGRKKGGSNVGKIVAALAAVIVVVVIIAAVALTRKTTINLNDYLTVTISEGYDSVGSASYSFDEDQFVLDYAGEIKLTSAGETAYGAYVGSILIPNAASLLAYDILVDSIEISQSENLSNGDTVTCSWSIDEESLEKYFNIKVKCDDVTVTVSGLEPIEEVDVFENVTIVFDGISPEGTASITVNSSDYSSADFILSKSSNLENGDSVTVTFSSSAAEDLKYSGKTPTAMSKTYTAELPKYITSLDDVADDFAAQYEDEISSIFEAENNLDETHVTFVSRNYVTDYCLTLKEESSWYETYLLYLIYEIEVEQDGTDMTYYWYIGLCNSYVNIDGTYGVDFDYYYVPTFGTLFDAPVYFDYSTYSVEDGIVSCSYTGYQKLSTLYEELIVGNERYSYEGKEYTAEDDVTQSSGERNIIEGAQEYDGHYYAVIEGRISWTEAEAICESLGGHLVTITSQSEQNFIETLTENYVWIGAYLDDNEDWKWTTDETWSFENWADGEPSGGDEENGCLWFEGEWNDLAYDSGEQGGFVCEWD